MMDRTPTSTIEYDYALLAPGLSRLGEGDVISLEPLVGGRNARVYRLDCVGGETFVAKIYPDGDGDGVGTARNGRRGREYAALRFMWQRGIRCIPEPIFSDPGGGYSVFRYVEGFPIEVEGVVDADVDSLVDFLVELDGLKREPASRALGQASEACLSVEAAIEHLQRRIGGLRLAADPTMSRVHAELRGFIEDALEPGFERAIQRVADLFASRIASLDTRLGEAEATLSPSDFGFHNARRTVEGSIVFLDFEHFGWDDPAKAASDFLLHPGFEIDDALRQRFFNLMCERHGCGPAIAWRVPVVFPLHAIKWSTILLNEFVSEHRARRDHAQCLLGPNEGLLERQLDRARVMLDVANRAVEQFPFARPEPETPRATSHAVVGS